MAALYDGDDNHFFTASRKEGKNTYQLFQRKPKESKSGRNSPFTAPSGDQHSLFWYGFSQNVLQTGDRYNYLTNQSGSMIGLTKDGQAVASTSYHLYSARKTSTDTTGDPFAYNGEDLDDTGLNYSG